MNDDFLNQRLNQRKDQDAFRSLKLFAHAVDFCSNDYLGIVKNNLIKISADVNHGSTGSRLLTGNSQSAEDAEKLLADFHQAESALLFNSGYDANIGLLSCLPQKGDTIIYDRLSHASLRDGIRLSNAQSFSFEHNNIDDLQKKLNHSTGNIFVVTESVFSMDGDTAPLENISKLCDQTNAFLIVDEAHATGVFGKKGEGIVQELQLQKKCFARIHTFGKACGVHGAAILGSKKLKDYLINFSRAFIYTTALPQASVTAIIASYNLFPILEKERQHLKKLIAYFNTFESNENFTMQKSESPIQAVIIPGNKNVKSAAKKLQDAGFDVRPILYSTVPKNTERLRMVLHAFNTAEEIKKMMQILQTKKP